MYACYATVALTLTLLLSAGSAAPLTRKLDAMVSRAAAPPARNLDTAVLRSRASQTRSLDVIVSGDTLGLELPTDLIAGTGAGTGAMQLVINVHTDSYGNIEVFTN